MYSKNNGNFSRYSDSNLTALVKNIKSDEELKTVQERYRERIAQMKSVDEIIKFITAIFAHSNAIENAKSHMKFFDAVFEQQFNSLFKYDDLISLISVLCKISPKLRTSANTLTMKMQHLISSGDEVIKILYITQPFAEDELALNVWSSSNASLEDFQEGLKYTIYKMKSADEIIKFILDIFSYRLARMGWLRTKSMDLDWQQNFFIEVFGEQFLTIFRYKDLVRLVTGLCNKNELLQDSANFFSTVMKMLITDGNKLIEIMNITKPKDQLEFTETIENCWEISTPIFKRNNTFLLGSKDENSSLYSFFNNSNQVDPAYKKYCAQSAPEIVEDIFRISTLLSFADLEESSEEDEEDSNESLSL